jgi:transcriptional regulator with XRE-family HTH domain
LGAGSNAKPKDAPVRWHGDKILRLRIPEMDEKEANPVDIHVGGRLKQRRTEVKMSQHQLGERLGLTFQQIQKYEKGANRIGAGRLFHISQILSVPIEYFYEELPADELVLPDGVGVAKEIAPHLLEYVMTAEGLELNRNFFLISDPALRRRLLDLVKMLGNADQPTIEPREKPRSKR